MVKGLDRSFLLLVTCSALLLSRPCYATIVNGVYSPPLGNADRIIDFGLNLFPIYTKITNQFDDVTFENAGYIDGGSTNGGGYLWAAQSRLVIRFDHLVGAVNFIVGMGNGPATATFSAYRNGDLVESFQAPSNLGYVWDNPGLYYGFWATPLDAIVIDTGDQYFGIDNLRFNFQEQPSVPEPATLPLIGLGLLSVLGFHRRKFGRPLRH